MKPAGYMAKLIRARPGSIDTSEVLDIFSVSGCISPPFAEYIDFWRHNSYWLFDSPSIIAELAGDHGIDLHGSKLFYYEVSEEQFDGSWESFEPERSLPTNVIEPPAKDLEGFDVVSFYAGTSPECSPLSCNAIASEVDVNHHCLLRSEAEAKHLLESGLFEHAEPGPYRIFAVYSIGEPWPPPGV